MSDRLTALTRRMRTVNTIGARCLVRENAREWAANNWKNPRSGLLGGAAYISKELGEIRLTDATATQVGYIYWPLNPGREFSLSFQLRTGIGATRTGGAFWVSLCHGAPHFSSVQTPSSPTEIRLIFNTQYSYLDIRGPGSSRVAYGGVWMGTGDAWTKFVVRISQEAVRVSVDGSVYVLAMTNPNVPRAMDIYCALCAETSPTASEAVQYAVKNIELWTHDMDQPSRDSRYLPSMEIQFPTYTLVRQNQPPMDAVTFGVHVNTGPIFAGVAYTWAHGCVPCKIVCTNQSTGEMVAAYTGKAVAGVATNGQPNSYISYNFYYLVPKPGFIGIRKRAIGALPATAVAVEYISESNTRVTRYMIALERTDTFTYGFWDTAGLYGEAEFSGAVSLTDNGAWDYVCVVPQTSRCRYVTLPRGTAITNTTNASWVENVVTAANGMWDSDQLATGMETKGAVMCHFQYAGGTISFMKGSPWPLRYSSTISTWAAMIRVEVLDAAKPPPSVSPSLYISTNYSDSTRNLIWRWMEGYGWYLNMNAAA